MDDALKILLKTSVETTTGSRTDSGVHAKQNFLHFDYPGEINTSLLRYQLNALLPKDISVNHVFRMPESAHCRFDALAREYHYSIIQRKDPFSDKAYEYYFPLDFHLLQQCADHILTQGNFETFSKKKTDVRTFICQVQYSRWIQNGPDNLTYIIRANRFLRGMVRALVGTTLQVGRGKMDFKTFQLIFEGRNNRYADFSPPGTGLCLERTFYPMDYFPSAEEYYNKPYSDLD